MGEAEKIRPQVPARMRELETVMGWFDAKQGSVALIRGRVGVGKSRLADEVVRAASSRPNAAIFETRVPDAGGRSFHPFAEIAHQAILWAEQAGLTESIVDPVYADISAVLDHAVAESDGAGPSLDQKLRFFDGFRRLVAGVGARARVLLVVRELERADSDTLELASFLADELFADPALDPENACAGLLMLTSRDDDPPRAVEDFLKDLSTRSVVHEVRLKGLDLEGLRHYVQSRHVLEKLLAASEGLPQELDALLDALPANVQELFERKLAEMDPDERAVLSAVAVSGRSVSARLLAAVTGQPGSKVARALNGLREQKVLERRIFNGEFQFAFTRRRDLEVAERFLSDAERRQLHSGWARALANEPEQGGSSLLAYHQLRGNDPEAGVPIAVQAAEAYAVGGALHAALETLESALPHAKGEMRASILSRLTELGPLTGSPRRALRYVAEWKAALPREAQGRALLREAELHNAAGDYAAALPALEQARAFTPEGALLERAEIEAARAEALYQLGRLDEANEAGGTGLELLSASQGESPTRLRLELLNLLGKVALGDGDRDRAIRFFEDTHEGAEKSGLAMEQARALINLGLVRIQAGDIAWAETALQAGIQKASEAGDLGRLAGGYLNLGKLLHQKGELGPAMECYRESRSLFRRLGNRTQLARTLANLGNVFYECGDLERAKTYNDEAARMARQSGVERLVGITRLMGGCILVQSGERAEGELRIRESIDLLGRQGAGDRPIEAMLELVGAFVAYRDHASALATLEQAEREMSGAESALVAARIDLLRGFILLGEGEPKPARAHFERARQAMLEMRRRIYVLEADIGLCRCAFAEGNTGEAAHCLARAESSIDEVKRALPDDVQGSFERSRMISMARQARAELEGRPVEAPSGAAPPPRAPAPVARKPEWKRRYGSIIGSSAKLMKVFHILDRVSDNEGAVLIHGESGTGKELIAEAIHRNSPRAQGPFVKLNCAALVETLLLSELFGHERGSFTGAHQRKIGRFEMAAGGTLFLDEIGDISPKTQVSLLRVLQEREFERVGGGKPIKVDARIIFATNRNLSQMVRDGTFREDLYYRIKGIQIDLPPLRERPEDVVSLAEHFLKLYAAESAAPQKSLSPEAASLLSSYGWPGNIRELENIVRSVALFSEGRVITAQDLDDYRELFQDAQLPPAHRAAPPPTVASTPEVDAPTGDLPASAASGGGTALPETPANGFGSADLPSPETAVDRELVDQIFAGGVALPDLKKMIQLQAITRALRMTGGNITKAADVLGMRRPRLSQIINADDELKALCQGASK